VAEIQLAKRLLQRDNARPMRHKERNIRTDENVRHEPATENLVDGKYAIAVSEPNIRDHELRPAPTGSGHSTRLAGFDRADMPHPCQDFGKQAADETVVFYDKDAKAIHRF
jgi:hypothetical protein